MQALVLPQRGHGLRSACGTAGGGAAGATDDIADDALNEREQQLQNELGQSTRMCRDLRMELAKARECLQDGDLRGADLVED